MAIWHITGNIAVFVPFHSQLNCALRCSHMTSLLLKDSPNAADSRRQRARQACITRFADGLRRRHSVIIAA